MLMYVMDLVLHFVFCLGAVCSLAHDVKMACESPRRLQSLSTLLLRIGPDRLS